MEHAMRAVDQDLGPVRYCTECREWWPEDEEFWHAGDASCRACEAERAERRRGIVRQAMRRFRERHQLGAP